MLVFVKLLPTICQLIYNQSVGVTDILANVVLGALKKAAVIFAKTDVTIQAKKET